MAGSRLHKFETIFERLEGLLKTGALKYNDRPIWYDVYKAFPPEVKPEYVRTQPNIELKKILYPEDRYRVKFYECEDFDKTSNLLDSSQDVALKEFAAFKNQNE